MILYKTKKEKFSITNKYDFRRANLIAKEYSLETFHRSNQDTCLVHNPAVFEGDWVQSGDLIADCAASSGGELSLGKNILVAYMPWEGYNFEDAILISERLVYEDVYSSIHIERYDIEIKETKYGIETITRDIPELTENELEHLDFNGVAKLGSWIKEGDILVGRITPINKKAQSTYKNLLYTILEKEFISVRDSSLRAPKGIKAKVINVQIYYAMPVPPFPLSKQSPFLRTARGKTKLPALDTSSKSSPFLWKKKKKEAAWLGKAKSQSILKEFKNKLVGEIRSRPTSFKRKRLLLKTTKSYQKKTPKQLLPSEGKAAKRLLKKASQHQTFLIPFLIPEGDKGDGFRKSPSPLSPSGIRKGFQKAKPLEAFLGHFFQKQPLLVEEEEGSCLVRQALKVFKTIYETPLLLKNLKRKSYLKLIQAKPLEALKKKVIRKKTPKVFGGGRTPNIDSFGQLRAEGKNDLKLLKAGTSYEPLLEVFEGAALFRANNEKGKINRVYVYLAEKRKIQVGDKMAGRHGNKGIVSIVLPRQDMPFLANGTPIDMVLNPLGVPSRMNVGQIYECLLGLASKYLGEHYKIFPFDEVYGPEASRSFVYSKLYEARKKTGNDWLFNPNCPGKTRLFDGRTGDPFDQSVTVGYAYMLKLVHLVDDKIHMRSTGPYSLVTQQPLRGRSKQGGQRLGEMEVWALEGYGAAFTLLEMLTIKSDDMTGRMTLWSNLILNKDISIGTPESFKVLVCELQALCLDIGIFRVDSLGNLAEIESLTQLP
uniref:DNA-directed RNA polymerase n=1 Tax=Chloromonas radiata TaxID=47907 RepID=A0A0S2ICJ1_9CHLO|nr:beta subunit of RNA polymerase [Chloromonas radiata]